MIDAGWAVETWRCSSVRAQPQPMAPGTLDAPADTDAPRPADVQLAVMVSAGVRDDARRRAFERGLAIRAVAPRALVADGVAELDEADLVERRP